MLQNNIDCQVLCIGFNFCFVSYHQCFELDLSLCFLLILISFKLFALDHYHLRFLDIGYFFCTLDDIGMTSQNYDQPHLRFLVCSLNR
ncbi:hypothetical protein RIR_jg14950.t1 [Rhizophagus irregularis DAOM 181602=DAOM 197198]|nr:hypothetical protein RIR_jg14950.t1 [Rhizophagus irregularis DAOM 181602=DAOM 197198]